MSLEWLKELQLFPAALSSIIHPSPVAGSVLLEPERLDLMPAVQVRRICVSKGTDYQVTPKQAARDLQTPVMCPEPTGAPEGNVGIRVV